MLPGYFYKYCTLLYQWDWIFLFLKSFRAVQEFDAFSSFDTWGGFHLTPKKGKVRSCEGVFPQIASYFPRRLPQIPQICPPKNTKWTDLGDTKFPTKFPKTDNQPSFQKTCVTDNQQSIVGCRRLPSIKLFLLYFYCFTDRQLWTTLLTRVLAILLPGQGQLCCKTFLSDHLHLRTSPTYRKYANG